MCFSATASFAAGSVLTATGIVSLKQTKKKNLLPFASIPLLFGIQQLCEGFVWLSLKWSLPLLNTFASYGFVFFSHILWPIFTPLAVALAEPIAWRKKLILICFFIGITVSCFSLFSIIFSPIQSQITCNSIRYNFSAIMQTPFSINILLYFVATCMGCLLSSHRLIKLFGFSVVAFLMLSYYFYTVTFVSVWCFFSAILSLIVLFFIKEQNSPMKLFFKKFHF